MLKKRKVSYVLILCLLVYFIGGVNINVATAAGSINVEAGTASGYPGDTVKVPIYFKNVPTDGLNNGNFYVLFDSNVLSYVGAVNGDIVTNSTNFKARLKPEGNNISVIFNDETQGDENILEDGLFAEISFKILDTATIGDCPIDMYAYGKFADINLASVVPAFTSGKITVLSNSTATPTSTLEPTATSTPVPTATNTPEPTATDTPVPTATSTPKPTATNTPVPTATDTPVPTATDTPVPTATDTPVPTATNTPVPTATDTPVPTATNTPVPTATDTPVPTATDTPVPTATDTPVPTATNTAKPTATNTAKPTATNTVKPTAINTPVPTVTNTVKPTVVSTATPTPSSLSTATPTNRPSSTTTPTAAPSPSNGSGSGSGSGIVPPPVGSGSTPAPTATSTVTVTPTTTIKATVTPTATPTPTVVVEEPAEEIPAAADINGHWAYDYIIRLMQQGIIEGYKDGTIKPNGLITRAEVAVTIVKAKGLQLPSDTKTIFADDKKIPKWAKAYIKSAYDDGIIKGYDDKEFKSSNNITRAEMAAMTMRAFGYSESSGELQFADADKVPKWARGYVAKAVELGIIKGYSDNTFKPGGNITRAESFTILAKCLDKQQ